MRTIRGHTWGAIGKSSGLFLALLGALAAAEPASPPPPSAPAATDRDVLAARAERLFQEHRTAFVRQPTDATVAWKFSRACFDWAEFATNNPQRAAIAQDGIQAARKALTLDTNLAAAPYYLGLNLGQLARVKRFSALWLVEEMRDQFEAARRLDSRFDFAGPDRNLGLLYLQAPGWPVSVGNRALARKHLEQAVALEPDYPENRLNLLEARLGWREKEALERELEALTELLPRARNRFAGEAWASGWLDWDRRWNEAQRRAARLRPRS
jgi:hypothetical protein